MSSAAGASERPADSGWGDVNAVERRCLCDLGQCGASAAGPVRTK
jgi:hypothetical protein